VEEVDGEHEDDEQEEGADDKDAEEQEDADADADADAERRRGEDETGEVLDAVVIGAGFSGVAAAAGLAHYGARFRLLERSDTVASIWKHNYTGLRMHSPFVLPYFRPKRQYSTLMSRTEVHEYVSEYFDHFQLAPHTRFHQDVVRAFYDPTNSHWQLETTSGDRYRARHLIVATGQNRFPHWPQLPLNNNNNNNNNN